jgi:hypothetical protein
MPLHESVQRLLLLGVPLERSLAPAEPVPPSRLAPLVAALAGSYSELNRRAVHFGHRYRSGYWGIYLLSALAVLCAVLPLALGWDGAAHRLHPYAGIWAFSEVVLIGSVSLFYWIGHRRDWQGQWLRARTTAELLWYLPVIAPLLDLEVPSSEPNWYLRIFDPGQHVRTAVEIGAHCSRVEPLTRTALAAAWADREFIASYARWTMQILEQQRHYHSAVVIKQHALQHRVHTVNTALFGLTAVGALAHLAVHTLWLSLITTFFPALGASLHGALAQSEAYRLQTTSHRLAEELTGAIERVRDSVAASAAGDYSAVKIAVEAAIALILEEHQDWNLLVRPHRLPLA